MKAYILNGRVVWHPLPGAVEMTVDDPPRTIDPETQRARVFRVRAVGGRVVVEREVVPLTVDEISKRQAKAALRAARVRGNNMNANEVKAAVVQLLELHRDQM